MIDSGITSISAVCEEESGLFVALLLVVCLSRMSSMIPAVGTLRYVKVGTTSSSSRWCMDSGNHSVTRQARDRTAVRPSHQSTTADGRIVSYSPIDR